VCQLALTPSFFADETAAGNDLRVLQGSCHSSSRELFLKIRPVFILRRLNHGASRLVKRLVFDAR
jgi:hypothetical protein